MSSTATIRLAASIGGLALVLSACATNGPDDDTAAPEDDATAEAEDFSEEEDEAPPDDAGLPEDYQLTLTWSAPTPEEHWFSQGDIAFNERIQELSNGQMELDIHWAQSLIPQPDHRTAMRDGVIDMATHGTAYEPAEYPINNWMSRAAFQVDLAPAIGGLQATGASLEWGFNEHSVREFEDSGVVPLLPSLQPLTSYHLLCTDPVESLDDAQGRQVRVPGPTVAAEAEAVGMSTVDMPTSEVYEAMQRGVLDCVVSGFRDMGDWNFIEVADHLMADDEVNFTGFFGGGVYIGQDQWDNMPVEAQRIIWDALPAYLEGLISAGMSSDANAIDRAVDIGVDLRQHDPDFRDALDGHHDEVLATMVDDRPDALDETEAEELYQMFEDVMNKWRDMVIEDLGYGQYPDNWDEYIAEGAHEELDVTPAIDRIWTEILEPRRP